MAKYVIKISGKIVKNSLALSMLLLDIQKLMHTGDRCVLVHGGGTILSEYCSKMGIVPQFDEKGRRITGAKEMDASDKILLGTINIDIVRLCQAHAIRAVGLSGADCGIAIGVQIENTFTGNILKTDTSVLMLLSEQDILPILCSVGVSKNGMALNINADELAQAIAVSMHADCLFFISDVSGILNNKQQIETYLDELSLAYMIKEGVIKNGMVIKSLQAQEALKKGVKKVVIGTYHNKGDLTLLLDNTKGTQITC